MWNIITNKYIAFQFLTKKTIQKHCSDDILVKSVQASVEIGMVEFCLDQLMSD